jgi:hypothetical protein
MPEPIKPTQPASETELRPDRPRYESPLVVHLGNSHAGQGGIPNPCAVGSNPSVQICAEGVGIPN